MDAPFFQEITRCLLGDAQPSLALRRFAAQPRFGQQPFSMLLLQQTTPQSPVHHPEGSVWNHTLMVVDQAALHREKSADPAALMWAALLHDLGKPSVTAVRRGTITAYGHDAVGAALAETFLSLLTDDAPWIQRVCGLVRYHMQLLYVTRGLPWQDLDGVRAHTTLRDIALLCYCDRMGRGNADPRAEQRNLRQFVQAIRRKECHMAKAGMRRPDPKQPHGTEATQKNHFPKNEAPPVPALQGKAKTGKKSAGPMN